MSIPMPDNEGVLPLKNKPFGGICDSGGKASEEVGKRVRLASSALPSPERDVSELSVDEMTIGLSGLSPWGPVEEVIIPVEGFPSMGEESEVIDGVGVCALVNVGLVVSTACIASTKEV